MNAAIKSLICLMENSAAALVSDWLRRNRQNRKVDNVDRHAIPDMTMQPGNAYGRRERGHGFSRQGNEEDDDVRAVRSPYIENALSQHPLLLNHVNHYQVFVAVLGDLEECKYTVFFECQVGWD